MADKIVVAILIFICVVTGIWGWWMENGPDRNDPDTNDKKEQENSEDLK